MAYLGRPGAVAPLTSADIPDNSITAAKIVDATIAAGDLANDVVINTSGSITTTGTLTSSAHELSTVQYVKNSKSFMIHPSVYANAGGHGSSNDKFKVPCDCKIIAHGMMKVVGVVSGGAYNQLEVFLDGQYTNNYGDGQTLNTWVSKSTATKTYAANDEVNIWAQAAYGPSYGTYLTLVIEITAL